MNPVLVQEGVSVVKNIPWKKVIIGLVIFTATYYLYKYIKNVIKDGNLREQARERKIAYEEYLDTKHLSHETGWYSSNADIIEEALNTSFWNGGGWYGCDQHAIYDVFKQLNSVDDYYALYEAFGTRSCNGSYFGSGVTGDLLQCFRESLQSSEIQELRNICIQKGFNAPF